MTKEFLSDCCSARPKSNGDNDSMDYGICPSCGEHCEFIEMVLDGEEDEKDFHSDADSGL